VRPVKPARQLAKILGKIGDILILTP
jgi:hypothetical protein